MTRLLVLCPSYRRPIAARAVRDSFRRNTTSNTTSKDVQLTFLVWEKDPDASLYDGHGMYGVVLCPEQLMVPRVNNALGLLDGFTHVGWVADDNRFSTKGWDERVMAALAEAPIVFCNDVVSPGAKPSHVFMDARIPRSLGWLMLPGVHSTFFDDAWANLGVGPGDVSGPLFSAGGACSDDRAGLGIRYLGDVRITHLYIEKDNADWFAKDHETYRHWLRHGAEEDIEKARRALRPRRDTRGPALVTLAGAQPGSR